MKKKGLALVIGIPLALVLVVTVGVFFGDAEDARTKRLKTLQVPADGAALFDFLLREIQDVVSQVPCVCCSEVLEGCYQGACPPSWQPCNDEGRDALAWFIEGKDVEEIKSLILAKYF